ncbi:plasmid maintenance protein [Borrelia sp. RT1S]|uniref:plasmid maintenance protein n=1 Tax=Borrelia sp. RT1S TaxID=2898580 RepID=UPI001E437BAF|nr:plasmid maintenance protein [Borrelia sp. RT1S]UGQ17893.1 plasmid maintenance protein [Borrelia sp. RT1S]
MITKSRKNYNTKPTPKKKRCTDLLLSKLIKLNESKDAASCSKIRVSQVKGMITRKLKRGARLYKVYWTIAFKNSQYRSTKQRYSASDIRLICKELLERDGMRKVGDRSIQKDIKLLNQMGLLETVTKRFVKNKGSVSCVNSSSYHIQNMKLASKYKQIIDTYLEEEIIEALRDKIIVGDFDKDIASVKFDKNQFDTDEIAKIASAVKLEENTISLNEVISKVISEVAKVVKFDKNQFDTDEIAKIASAIKPEEINMSGSGQKKHSKRQASLQTKTNKPDKKLKQQQVNTNSKNSHIENSHIIKLNNNYNKNSIEVDSEKGTVKKKTTQENRGVASRLAFRYKVSSRYMNEIGSNSPNEATYINALLNLETAIKQYEKEYSIKDIASHFKEQFISRYKRKIWMMMKRKDEVVSDYHIIWELRFKDRYKAKEREKERQVASKKAACTTKETRDIVFSVLLDRLERGPDSRYLLNIDLRKAVRLYMNSLGDKVSYKGILNDSYYNNILDRLVKDQVGRACSGFATELNVELKDHAPRACSGFASLQSMRRQGNQVSNSFKSSALKEVR